MTEPAYIHVAMHGHFDGKLAVKYTFNDDNADWMASLPDPDAIVRNFISARECYVMWHNEFGHYFSIITTDPLDSGAGRVMVTVMADNGCMIPGRSVFTALSGLKKTFLEDRILNEEAVIRVLQAASIPDKPVEIAAWQWDEANAPTPDSLLPMCYRTYLSTRELESIFSFPDQPDYNKFVYHIVLNATSSLRPGIAIDRLTAPIRKEYSVICPEGVNASADTIEEGRQLLLTFTKEGFSPRRESVTAGVPSPFVIYDGPVMKIKSPAGQSSGFVRKVRVTVKNGKGGLVNGYTMSVNDRPVNTMEPFIELTEADLLPGRRVEVQVASNNFHPLVKSFEADELAHTDAIELSLVPVEQGITLRLVFGEGRVFEQQISLEKNTPEYSQLHSGYFHGFRAQKMVTPHGGEIYNVDVRAAGKPVAPTFDNVAPSRDKERTEREVPHFENTAAPRPDKTVDVTVKESEEVSIATHIDKEVSQVEMPEPKPEPKVAHTYPDNYVDETQGLTPKAKWLIIGASAMAVIAAIIFFFPSLVGINTGGSGTYSGDIDTEFAEQTAVTAEEAVTAAATAQQAAPTTTAGPTADEQADIAYLNSTAVWRADALRSEKYRALFEMLRNGDIKSIANHDYFAVEGQAVNDEAVKMLVMAWKSMGSGTQRSNEVAIKKGVKDEAFSVHDVYEAVARVQPKASEANAEERPMRR